MKICAVILNYFNWHDTVVCVNSIINQPVTRIVILDNSASESEENALRNAFKDHPCVDVMKSETNLGFAGGMNHILRQILTLGFDSFLILNNDTIAPADLIENLIKGAYAESFDIASPSIFNYPHKNQLWSEGYYYNKIMGVVTHKPISFLPYTCFYLAGCCMLVRRDVFERIGLFDESFFMYGEDVEFSYRAVQKGYRIGIVKDAKLYHHVSLSTQNNSLFYEYHITRSHFLLIRKFYETKFKRKLSFIFKVIILGLRAIVRTVRYKNLNALSGYKMAFFEALFFKPVKADN